MMSKNKEEFFDKISDTFDTVAKINAAKRSIIKKRIELGAAPLYTLGYMDISKQYSTFGVVGLNESLSLLGYDILSEEGQNFVIDILDLINSKIEIANKRFKAPHNCEQVPQLNEEQ